MDISSEIMKIASDLNPKVAKVEDAELDTIIRKVEKLTDSNDHTVALMVIAMNFGLKSHYKKLSLISELHNIERSMPSSLGKYRSEVATDLMYKFVKRDLTDEQFKRLNSAL